MVNTTVQSLFHIFFGVAIENVEIGVTINPEVVTFSTTLGTCKIGLLVFPL